jgi:sterol desaturase/sphingolipid hydroxylase (fatty acid hydroxylase superfamily)
VIFSVGVWLVLWVVLAIPLAGRKIRDSRPPARQLLIEFACSIRSIMIFSTVGLLTFGLFRAGWMPGPYIARGWGPAWFWTSLVLMIVAHDAWFYWTHRLIHDRRLFRRFHRRHHRSNNPSPFTAYSFDLGEAAINALFVPLWMILVPTQWPVAGLFMLHQIVRNTMGHSGYELFPARKDGRPLMPWLTTRDPSRPAPRPGGLELRALFHLVGQADGHREPALSEAFRPGEKTASCEATSSPSPA